MFTIRPVTCIKKINKYKIHTDFKLPPNNRKGQLNFKSPA